MISVFYFSKVYLYLVYGFYASSSLCILYPSLGDAELCLDTGPQPVVSRVPIALCRVFDAVFHH